MTNSGGISYIMKINVGYESRDWGGSPGLVVMGGDSCSEGCGFESWYRILD